MAAAALLTVAATHKLAANEDLRHSAHASDALQGALHRTALRACNAPCNLAQHQWLAMVGRDRHRWTSSKLHRQLVLFVS